VVEEPKYLSRYRDWTNKVRFSIAMAFFSLLQSVQTGSEFHPAYYTMDKRRLCPGAKRPGCEADHSSVFSAEVKNDGAMRLLLHTVFVA
jgi:hypothetical protein